MWLFKSCPVLMLAMALSACSTVVHIQSPVSQPPLVEKIPISVGVFYSENLRHYKCVVDKGYIAASWIIELGPASVEMFNLIFGALFEEVIVVDSVTSGFEKGLKSVIEVRLLGFNGCEASWPIFGASVKVAYEVILRGEDGIIIGGWQCRGEAVYGDSREGCSDKGLGLDPEGRYLGALTCVGMRRAVAEFIVNFQKDSQARAYLGK
jgi:hypothetical protein